MFCRFELLLSPGVAAASIFGSSFGGAGGVNTCGAGGVKSLSFGSEATNVVTGFEPVGGVVVGGSCTSFVCGATVEAGQRRGRCVLLKC